VARQAFADHLAGLHVEGGKQRCGAVALVVVRHRLRRPFFIGRPGCVRIWLFSSTQRTIALSAPEH